MSNIIANELGVGFKITSGPVLDKPGDLAGILTSLEPRDVLFIDEATQHSEAQMHALRACVRGVNNYPKRIYCTMNPGGVGHGWVKRLFIDRQYLGAERAEDYSFIRSLVTDNAALMASDPDYLRSLQALPDKLRRAWLDGDWDIYEGQFFEDFRLTPDLELARRRGFAADSDELRRQRRFTHVIEPFDLAAPACRGWTVFRSYDFGYGRPFSCAWWAVDYDGRLYRILEYYGCTAQPNQGLRLSPDEQFREIARMAPVASRAEHRRRGRPEHLGREPRRERRGDGGALRAVLPAGRQPPRGGLDAVPLPAAVRRGGAAGDVRVRGLRGVSAHGAAAAVLGGAAGGRGHGAGGSRGGRVAVRVHVAADRAADRAARPRAGLEPAGVMTWGEWGSWREAPEGFLYEYAVQNGATRLHQPLSFRDQSADWSWESASPVPKLPRQGEPR